LQDRCGSKGCDDSQEHELGKKSRGENAEVEPRRTAPTFCKEEEQIDVAGIDPWTRIRSTRPWTADTILDRNDSDQSFASGSSRPGMLNRLSQFKLLLGVGYSLFSSHACCTRTRKPLVKAAP